MILDDYVTVTGNGERASGRMKLRAEPTLCNQLNEVCEILQQNSKLSLTLDCHSVDYISQQSGSLLLRLLKTLRDEGYALMLTNVAQPTCDILESMGIADLIPIVDDEDLPG